MRRGHYCSHISLGTNTGSRSDPALLYRAHESLGGPQPARCFAYVHGRRSRPGRGDFASKMKTLVQWEDGVPRRCTGCFCSSTFVGVVHPPRTTEFFRFHIRRFQNPLIGRSSLYICRLKSQAIHFSGRVPRSCFDKERASIPLKILGAGRMMHLCACI